MSRRDYLSPINHRARYQRTPAIHFSSLAHDSNSSSNVAKRRLSDSDYSTSDAAITSRSYARDNSLLLCVVIVIHLSSIRRYESNRLSRSVGWYIIIFIHGLIEVCNWISEHVDIDCAWPGERGAVRCGGGAALRERGRRCLQTSVTTRDTCQSRSSPATRRRTRVYANNSEPSQLTLSHFERLPARLDLRYDHRIRYAR